MKARTFRFHPAASRELDAAGKRYDEALPGMSLEFLHAVESAIAAIMEHPAGWQRDEIVAGREIRRFVMRRFPFSIVYYVVGNVARIVAVAHAKRKPGYWRSRTSDVI